MCVTCTLCAQCHRAAICTIVCRLRKQPRRPSEALNLHRLGCIHRVKHCRRRRTPQARELNKKHGEMPYEICYEFAKSKVRALCWCMNCIISGRVHVQLVPCGRELVHRGPREEGDFASALLWVDISFTCWPLCELPSGCLLGSLPTFLWSAGKALWFVLIGFRSLKM